MKELLKRILFLSLLALLLFTGVFFIPGIYPHDLSSLINKMDMLKSKKSPRIIFVGGSNLVHLKSHIVEKELKYSVVNMGLWGGLSIKNLLEEIKAYLHPNDVVVIISEYPVLFNTLNKEPNDESRRIFFLMYPEKYISGYLGKAEYFALFKDFFILSQYKVKGFCHNLLTNNFSHIFKNGNQNYHKDYNEYGDMVDIFPEIRPLDGSGYIFSDTGNMNRFSLINNFYYSARKQNAYVFLSFPPFPFKEYKLNEKQLNDLYRDLKKYLKSPILNSPVDHTYPREFFADTIYHLNTRGESLRVKRLVKELKNVLLNKQI